MNEFEASHIADGISQAERYPLALQPDYFKIDERDMDDMLRFVVELSKHFNYYNLNNQIDGDWEDILLSDINVILHIIPKFDVNSFIKKYEQLKSGISRHKSDDVNIHAVNQVFKFLNSFLEFQESVHSKFRASTATNQGITDFKKMVFGHDSFETEAETLDQLVYQARNTFGEAIELPVFKKIRGVEAGSTIVEEESLLGSYTIAQIDHLLNKTNKLFGSLRSKYSRLSEAAEWYLYKQKDIPDNHEPHIALLVSFLELYNYLRKDINQLTGKHLDFYYKQILGLKTKEAKPDQVHVVMNINPAFEQHFLPKGEILVAAVPDSDQVIQFATDDDLQLTKATIRELTTVYVNEIVKIPSGEDVHEDVKESRVFFSNNPVSADKDSKSWPLLGEDQSELSFKHRSMQSADIGLLISSPLLYAEDGKRNYYVRFYLQDESAANFMTHVKNFSKAADSYENVMISEMLSKAFILSITGKDGWISIEKYAIGYKFENVTDKYFEVNFELGHNDPATVVYQPDIHGSQLETKWPLLRLQINNNSFHNPYSFLKDMVLKRVGIRLKVKGSVSVKLQNNIGSLSMASPFQVFGPQPSVGSYLDIHNPNIFNSYTKEVKVHFHWFDLPRDKGGFETYYTSYPKYFGNDAFKIALSSLNDGQYQPVTEQRQQYSLFQMGKEPGTIALLNNVTSVTGFDFTKIKFGNKLSLEEIASSPEGNYREGSVRFELISPEEGFGHRIFPGLFPEVIMHNAKRFRRKIPIPNQPYIPVLRQISVDYELKYTEAVNGLNKESEKENTLNLWHFTPFGYRVNYPDNDASDLTFVPVVKDQSNLLIGLENARPGELLSLFFQIEDNHNADTSFEVAGVNWSVLQDNRWEKIPQSDVLKDSTGNFIKNGIVVLRLPVSGIGNNTVLNPLYYWIKVSCNRRGNLRTKVKGIYTQAVTASRILENGIHYNMLQLAPGMIKGTAKSVPQIQQVIQPYPSYNGKVSESVEKYYARVSERLYHKQRPLTTVDITEMVLEAFPGILKVHCLGAGVSVTARHTTESDIKILVIPSKKPHTVPGRLQEPKVTLATLFDIKKMISSKLPSFINVDVVNPVYERVKVVCKVMFSDTNHKGNVGSNISQLNQDISRFLSPWLFSNISDVQIEGKLYTSEILNFIKKCPYVAHVTAFSVLHFYRTYDEETGRYVVKVVDSAVDNVNFLKGSLPGSILISAPEHEIIVIKEKKHFKPEKSGIGVFVLGEELLVAGTKKSSEGGKKKKEASEERFDFTFYTTE